VFVSCVFVCFVAFGSVHVATQFDVVQKVARLFFTLKLQPFVYDYLYDDWMSYYWEFLSWGLDSDWMAQTSARFVPQVWDAPGM